MKLAKTPHNRWLIFDICIGICISAKNIWAPFSQFRRHVFHKTSLFSRFHGQLCPRTFPQIYPFFHDFGNDHAVPFIFWVDPPGCFDTISITTCVVALRRQNHSCFRICHFHFKKHFSRYHGQLWEELICYFIFFKNQNFICTLIMHFCKKCHCLQ